MDLDPGTSDEEVVGGATQAIDSSSEGREASSLEPPSANPDPNQVGQANTTTPGGGTTTSHRPRHDRPDEVPLVVDWDALINRNPSGWSGEHSLISHVSYPEMDAILGWATHQTGPTSHSRRRRRRRREEVATTRRPTTSRNPPDDDQGAEHSRLLLPSSSVVLSPPSLLELLEQKSRTALDPARHRKIWGEGQRWRHPQGSDTINPTPPPPAAAPRLAERVTAPVAMGCVLEEAMVERLLPIARAYVEHCRRPLRSPVPVAAGGYGREGAGDVKGRGDRMDEGDDDQAEVKDDDQSTFSEVDTQESQDADVEAWTVSPDQAMCAMLLDRGVGNLDDEPADVERRERILAYLERWKGTKTLIESLRI